MAKIRSKIVFLAIVEFPACISIPLHASSVILDCILSLDIVHIPLLAKEIHSQIRNSVCDSRLAHVLQRFVGTNILSIVGLLLNHGAMFLRA